MNNIDNAKNKNTADYDNNKVIIMIVLMRIIVIIRIRIIIIIRRRMITVSQNN